MSSTIGRSFVLAAGLVFGLVPHASADVITVDDDLADLPAADFTSLQDAINAAVSGDEIVVYPGTYEEQLTVDGKDIVIRSTDPADPLVVAATDIEPASPGIYIGNISPASVEFRGLQFSRVSGNAETVAVLFGGSLVIEDCVILNFPTPAAGAVNTGLIRVDDGDFRVTRTDFDSNGRPGIRLSPDSNLDRVVDAVIEDCSFSGDDFGSISVAGGGRVVDLTIQRCRFISSNPGNVHPAIRLADTTGVAISECRFENYNFSNGSGAVSLVRVGASNSRPSTIERCEFLANRNGQTSNASRGGAVWMLNSSVIVDSSVFIGNEAVSTGSRAARGGAIYADGNDGDTHEVVVVNSTFYDNGAIATGSGSQNGGAIYADGTASVTVINSLLSRNGPGGAIAGNVTLVSSLNDNTPGYIVEPDGKNNGWTDNPLTITNETANNDYGDLRLAESSPAINAGDNAEVISATDLDGDLRIRGGLVDQGAYESRFAQYFVDGSAASSGTGLSWGEAVRTLAELPIDGGEAEVRLAQGTYVVPDGGFELGTGAWIRGGFNANNGNQNPANNPVVLTGDLNGDDLPDGVNRADNATHVLWSNTASDVTIDGVTISGANSDSLGGGLMLEEVLNLLIVDVIIEDNDARRGGGVAIRGGDGVMTDTIVRNNRGSRENGGMRVDGGATMVIQNSEIRDNSSIEECGGAGFYNGANAFVNNTVFTGNTSEIDVGGVEVSNNVGSDPAYVELFNTIITGNSAAGEASGVRYAKDASGVIDQSMITENTALENGVIAVRDNAMLLLRQSTIAGNESTGGDNAGLDQAGAATLGVINTIVHGNTALLAPTSQDAQLKGSGVTMDYSLVEGWDGTFAGTGTIDGDPAFVDAPNGDYHIDAGSDAIDAGDTNTLVDLTDLDGNDRVLDDTGTVDTGIGGPPTIDIGAYEFQGTSGPTPCGAADLATPIGELDFFDVLEYLGQFDAEDASADLAAPFGSFDFFDVLEYLGLFDAGCD